MTNVIQIYRQKEYGGEYNYYIYKAAVEETVVDVDDGYITMTLNYMSSPLTIKVKEDTYRAMATEAHEMELIDKLYDDEPPSWAEYAHMYGLPCIFIDACPYICALP